MIVLLHDLDLNFQDKTFSNFALAIHNAQAEDVPGRFGSTRTASAVELLLVIDDIDSTSHASDSLNIITSLN